MHAKQQVMLPVKHATHKEKPRSNKYYSGIVTFVTTPYTAQSWQVLLVVSVSDKAYLSSRTYST